MSDGSLLVCLRGKQLFTCPGPTPPCSTLSCEVAFYPDLASKIVLNVERNPQHTWNSGCSSIAPPDALPVGTPFRVPEGRIPMCFAPEESEAWSVVMYFLGLPFGGEQVLKYNTCLAQSPQQNIGF